MEFTVKSIGLLDFPKYQNMQLDREWRTHHCQAEASSPQSVTLLEAAKLSALHKKVCTFMFFVVANVNVQSSAPIPAHRLSGVS